MLVPSPPSEMGGGYDPWGRYIAAKSDAEFNGFPLPGARPGGRTSSGYSSSPPPPEPVTYSPKSGWQQSPHAPQAYSQHSQQWAAPQASPYPFPDEEADPDSGKGGQKKKRRFRWPWQRGRGREQDAPGEEATSDVGPGPSAGGRAQLPGYGGPQKDAEAAKALSEHNKHTVADGEPKLVYVLLNRDSRPARGGSEHPFAWWDCIPPLSGKAEGGQMKHTVADGEPNCKLIFFFLKRGTGSRDSREPRGRERTPASFVPDPHSISSPRLPATLVATLNWGQSPPARSPGTGCVSHPFPPPPPPTPLPPATLVATLYWVSVRPNHRHRRHVGGLLRGVSEPIPPPPTPPPPSAILHWLQSLVKSPAPAPCWWSSLQ